MQFHGTNSLSHPSLFVPLNPMLLGDCHNYLHFQIALLSYLPLVCSPSHLVTSLSFSSSKLLIDLLCHRSVNGQLAVSRALGDTPLHPYVSSDPEIHGPLNLDTEARNQFVVLACDGVWDVLTDEEATRYYLSSIFSSLLISVLIFVF